MDAEEARQRVEWLKDEERREHALFDAWFQRTVRVPPEWVEDFAEVAWRAWWAGGTERRRKDGPGAQ